MINIDTIVTNLLTLVVWPIFAGAATIMFIWAGFTFLTASGDVSKIAQAKKAVLWGAIGIGVGLAAFSAKNIVTAILGV